jgi:biopolymer transport protein ExbD
MIATRMALALVPTAAAIPVAVLATCSYNFLRTRIDLLECGVFDERQQRGRHFRGARRFPQTKRFSELPAFGLLAVPALVFAIAGCMTFASFHTPKGFYVELASARCESDAVDRLIVLHITDTGEVFLNLEHQDWNTLASRLSQIYGLREHRTLYLLADADVPFQTVADALDTADKLDIQVQLVTPKVFNTHCLLKPVVTGSSA